SPMPAAARCPKCASALMIPDALLGHQVRCQKCGTTFIVAAPRPAAPPPPAPRKAARVPALPRPAAITVVARRADADDAAAEQPVEERVAAVRSPAPWVVAAILAFLLPIAAAGGFAALMWSRTGSVATDSSAG